MLSSITDTSNLSDRCTTSGTCGFANIIALPASRADVACCRTVSTLECAAGMLGIAQVGVQWFCFSVILLLFVVFFPRTPTLPILDDHTQQHTWRTAVTVALACLLHGFVTIIISVSLALARPDALGVWANTLGIIATILAAIQYLPQIWLTYNLGHIGSLSIPMMCIQTPGSFLWSGSLAARLGWGGWSTWGVFLVTGFLQGCLLALGISFSVKARREKRNSEAGASNGRCIVGYIAGPREHDTDDEGGTTVESTPLLSESGSTSKPRRNSARNSTSN
ncbi:hypothetical protein DSL72_006013 [Monilinia vaccinii-corymbosi]|uniref:PQ loop repeat protein n=1 Tax=Monilinia vaccinii-corymbosi TaxID=61207 RepID=A0A8A3PHF3_9HELO|nr:hypothetical protein DSL72_006013 [Monilinia vaccinii-corymbosi]